jgi:SNF2 family DNA or RNA helicase
MTGRIEREKAIELFQGGKTNLFIGQIAAAGIGITLTRASHCILAECDYSPATMSQAINRLHRIGQKNSVNVYFLLVEDSSEYDIMQILVDKIKAFDQVLA